MFLQNLEESTPAADRRNHLAQRTAPLPSQWAVAALAADMQADLRDLGKALLILHAPGDEVISIDHAAQLFAHARHPKSFITLDTADHLLSDRSDAAYAGAAIAIWVSRYLVPVSQAGVTLAPGDDAAKPLVHAVESTALFAQFL